MPLLVSLIFRKLTDADFFNINKPQGTETGGGGQSYIDISTSRVTLENWHEFFENIKERSGSSGPIWKFSVKSLRVDQRHQEVTIAQRRGTSVSIRSQKLQSRNSNRINAWNPDLAKFPKPRNPSIRGHIYNLVVYIARLDSGEYWAGWFHAGTPNLSWSMNDALNEMFNKNEGYLRLQGDVEFDKTDPEWPFRVVGNAPSETAENVEVDNENEELNSMFNQDEDIRPDATPRIREAVRKIRIRNTKAVKDLKKLYEGRCQVTGKSFTFKTTDGIYYSEAHHLIPLSLGGADNVYNIVIISPLVHRMLHYAKVTGLKLKNIKNNKLPIKINGKKYVIKWDPRHGRTVKKHSLTDSS